MSETSTPIHGGALAYMSARYQIPVSQWLDLSTGIAPFSYPIDRLPTEIWQRLPEPDPKLVELACNYYHCQSALAIAGSQQVIQSLPDLCQKVLPAGGRVWLPAVGYKGHALSWQMSERELCYYSSLPCPQDLGKGDVLVVINPNNPTAAFYTQAQLKPLHQALQQQQGLLIVDEAFMDVMPAELSMAPYSHLPAILVLRSIGKFFGLAGIRLGFVLGSEQWLTQLKAGQCWNVNGPAIYIGKQVLVDTNWQQQQLLRLQGQSDKLQQLLQRFFPQNTVGTSLFCTQYHAKSALVFEQLARNGVYVRLTDEKDALRFGISCDHGLQRLEQALENIRL